MRCLICEILASCTMARGKWHLEDFDCVQHSSLVDWTSLGRWLPVLTVGRKMSGTIIVLSIEHDHTREHTGLILCIIYIIYYIYIYYILYILYITYIIYIIYNIIIIYIIYILYYIYIILYIIYIYLKKTYNTYIYIYTHLTFCLNMHAYWSTYCDGQRDFSTCSKSWGIGVDPVGCSPGNEAAAFNRAWRVKTAPPVHLCPSDLAESKNLRLGEVMGIKREARHSAANPWKLAVESR